MGGGHGVGAGYAETNRKNGIIIIIDELNAIADRDGPFVRCSAETAWTSGMFGQRGQARYGRHVARRCGSALVPHEAKAELHHPLQAATATIEKNPEQHLILFNSLSTLARHQLHVSFGAKICGTTLTKLVCLQPGETLTTFHELIGSIKKTIEAL